MDLLERQISLEEEYSTQGVLMAISKHEADVAAGRLADTGPGRTFTIRAYKLVRDELEALCTAGTRGMGARYRKLVKEVGYDECAVVGLRVGLNLLSKVRNNSLRSGLFEPIIQDFLVNVGQAAEAEHALKKLQIAAPGYMNRVLVSMADAGTKNLNHRVRTLKASAKNVGVEEVAWPVTEQVGVGRLILEATISAGVFEVGAVPKGKGQEWKAFRATTVTRENLDRMTSMIKGFSQYPPMLVPPKPHTLDTLFSGASYMTDSMSILSATVRTRTRRRDHYRWVRENFGQMLLDVANKAAQQPYRIDTETATLIQRLMAEGVHSGCAGLPSINPITPPEYPLPEGWDHEDEELMETHVAWKALARQAYSDETVRKAQVLAFTQTMRYLRDFGDDVLYFPTYFDWRGRLYFRSRINPQSQDFVKAVIKFADKKPLGKRGVYWLKVAVATTYGFDKKLMDTRAVWTDDHMDAIREAVEATVDSEFFKAADSPWCFYVAARELIRALDSGSPETWETGVPIAMDATCSGLQHFSALLRDPVGGLLTNLMPTQGDEKEDIYAAVAGLTVGTVQKDRDNPEQGQYWLSQGIPRNMAKKPVMTFVYSGTLQSCMEYIYSDMMGRDLPRTENYSQFKLSAYISKHIRKNIEVAVPAAAECMRFLKSTTRYMEENVAMRWVTPAGFPVLQHYAQEEIVRVKLQALGIDLNMIRYQDHLLDKSKCANGIAPNFVHSLDSAHLVRVINAFKGQIVPIHDSFATHPSDVDYMHEVLRDEFVAMYTETDPLDSLMACLPEDHGLERPARGTLDLELVKRSEFFMC